MRLTEDDYYGLGICVDDRFAIAKKTAVIQAEPMIARGTVTDKWFEDAWVQLGAEGGIMIPDFIPNLFDSILLSNFGKDFLIKQGLTEDQYEYLPFVLKDGKGRVVKGRQFYWVNPLLRFPCLDLERSTVLYGVRPNEILDVEMMHIKTDHIPEDAKLFRVAEAEAFHVLRRDLVEAIAQEGFEGIHPLPMGRELGWD